MTTVALLGSPLLGPAMWQPTAVALARLGWNARVIPPPPRTPRRPDDVLEHLLAQLPSDETVALTVHSNAGLYVPALTASRPVVATVFADAALPPASGNAPMAPAAMLDWLRDMADTDGLLPPWTQWWPDEQLTPLFPDPASRARVEAEQHRLPLEYFTAVLPVTDGWTTRPAAYLAFSDAYLRERDRATGWGWPVRTVTGGHLHPLVDPAGTACAIEGLLHDLGVRAEGTTAS